MRNPILQTKIIPVGVNSDMESFYISEDISMFKPKVFNYDSALYILMYNKETTIRK